MLVVKVVTGKSFSLYILLACAIIGLYLGMYLLMCVHVSQLMSICLSVMSGFMYECLYTSLCLSLSASASASFISDRFHLCEREGVIKATGIRMATPLYGHVPVTWQPYGSVSRRSHYVTAWYSARTLSAPRFFLFLFLFFGVSVYMR